MNTKSKSLQTFLVAILLFAVSSPAAFSKDICNQGSLERDLNEKLGPQLEIDSLVQAVVLFNVSILGIDTSTIIPSSKTLRLNGVESLRETKSTATKL